MESWPVSLLSIRSSRWSVRKISLAGLISKNCQQPGSIRLHSSGKKKAGRRMGLRLSCHEGLIDTPHSGIGRWVRRISFETRRKVQAIPKHRFKLVNNCIPCRRRTFTSFVARPHLPDNWQPRIFGRTDWFDQSGGWERRPTYAKHLTRSLDGDLHRVAGSQEFIRERTEAHKACVRRHNITLSRSRSGPARIRLQDNNNLRHFYPDSDTHVTQLPPTISETYANKKNLLLIASISTQQRHGVMKITLSRPLLQPSAQ